LPPLPVIQSNTIHHRIFTNKMRMGGLQVPRTPGHTNAIYQALGDALVSVLAWEFLNEYLSNVKFMSLHTLKGDLASNRFLGSLAVEYKLHRSLTLSPGYRLVDGLEKHKIHADLFEAYIGGLYYDQGLDAVREWLRPIFKAEMHRALELRTKYDPTFTEEPKRVRYTNEFVRRRTEMKQEASADEETPHGYTLALDALERRQKVEGPEKMDEEAVKVQLRDQEVEGAVMEDKVGSSITSALNNIH
ncbi:ribonuclease III domain-containing protein, partial [Schizophyllum fasciatum]